MYSKWSKEVFVIKKVKSTVPCTYLISYLKDEEISRTFYDEELQKIHQEEFRIEKLIKKKWDKLYSWIDKKGIIYNDSILS